MQFILILALLALVAMKLLGKLNVSWLIIAVVGALAAFYPVIMKLKDSLLDLGTGMSTSDTRDACQCRSGQFALVRHKPFLKKPRVLKMGCASALNFVSQKASRAQLVGCSY